VPLQVGRPPVDAPTAQGGRTQFHTLAMVLLGFKNPTIRCHSSHGKNSALTSLCGNCAGAVPAVRAAVRLSGSDAPATSQPLTVSRRSLLLLAPLLLTPIVANAAGAAPKLDFKTSSNGLQWADATAGSGSPFQTGQRVVIDYVMSTTGARYGSKIDSTKDRNAPYAWTLGDGSTILGLEQAITGGDGVPPMLPGGVRRIIVPSELAYKDLAKTRTDLGGLQFQECSPKGGRGPIPPDTPQSSGDMGAGEFQRFRNIYCNSLKPYQPDLVLDIKLYGKRG